MRPALKWAREELHESTPKVTRRPAKTAIFGNAGSAVRESAFARTRYTFGGRWSAPADPEDGTESDIEIDFDLEEPPADLAKAH